MKGIFVNCPWKECNKMLLKNAYLRPGSYFTLNCYYCGVTVGVNAQPGKVELKIIKIPDDYLTDDDESDIIIMKT